MKNRIISFILLVILVMTSAWNAAPINVSASMESFETNPKIAIGENCTIALKSDGTVWAWGENDSGQLGNGTFDRHSQPKQVVGLENIVDIDVSYYGDKGIALKSDGTVWVWGYIYDIYDGQYDKGIPLKIEGIEDVIDISIGTNNVVALKSDGSVWTWGENDAGQLGIDVYDVYGRKSPDKVEGIEDVIAVSASGLRVAALKSDGTVWIWGGGTSYGTRGGGDEGCDHPVKVNGIGEVKAIVAGDDSGDVYMLQKDGSVLELDTPRFENDENGERVLITEPEQIQGLADIETISAGIKHVVAIDLLGMVWLYENEGEPEKIDKLQDSIFVETAYGNIEIAAGRNIERVGVTIKKDGSIWALDVNRSTYRIFDDFSLKKIELVGISLDAPTEVEGSDMCVVEVDEAINLSVIYEPLDASVDKTKVQWYSSNSDIVSVENGKVTGIDEGKVTITASVDGKIASCEVTVIPTVGYDKCTSCNGEGKVKCWDCGATGESKCDSCGGDGKSNSIKSCTKCNGAGEIGTIQSCQICHGTGLSYSDTLQSYVFCAFCDGTGEFLYTKKCSTCDGGTTVVVEEKCSTCKGKGRVTCSWCDAGYNECYSCNGKGKLKRKLYAVTYDANGGINAPETQLKVENVDMQISDVMPTREGYVFCGWAIESTATEIDYLSGEYIKDNSAITLYAVWEEEKILSSINIAQMPYKVTYVEGEDFDSEGLIVTARYSNNVVETITDYEITGYDSAPGEKRICITYCEKTVDFTVTVKEKIPEVITSSIYKVSDTAISKVTIGTSVEKLISGINENKYIKVFKKDAEVSANEIVGTGMTIKIMDENKVIKNYRTIITGDVNGDGNASVTDMLAIKAHILGKNKLSDEYATAADTSGDSGISITDFIQVKAYVLGKGNITAR